MNCARINEWFCRFIWSSLSLANGISRWDGFAVSVPSKLQQTPKTSRTYIVGVR